MNEEALQNKAVKLERMLRFARSNLLHFIMALHKKYEPNWHHMALCETMMRFYFGDLDRLMVFMPPQHGKTEIVNRYGTAYKLGHDPDCKIVSASYGADLASSVNLDVQKIMESELYQAIFPKTRLAGIGDAQHDEAKRTASRFDIVGFDGFMKSTGVGGALTGNPADILKIDDPFKDHKEALSPTKREDVFQWFLTTARSRIHSKSKICIVNTRWHDDDLCGRLLKLAKEDPSADQYEVISFEALRTNKPNPKDPRKVGEALWPQRHTLQSILATKASLPDTWFNALYQQDPVPESSEIFSSGWWVLYDKLPEGRRPDGIFQFWDCAQKPGITNDFSVGATWYRYGERAYLVEIFRARMDAPSLENAIVAQWAKHRPGQVYIEDKAAGISIIQTLRFKHRLIPVVPYDPGQRDKVMRALMATPMVKNGMCFLPRTAPWLDDFINEHRRFPAADHDDQVDTTSMMAEVFLKLSGFAPSITRLR